MRRAVRPLGGRSMRIVKQGFVVVMLAGLMACSTAPAATDNGQQGDAVTNGPKTCEQMPGKNGLSQCVDCCLAQNPSARPFANALGACNSKCGKKGSSSACFSAC